MNIISFLFFLIIAILVSLGIYFLISRVKTTSDLISQAQDKLSPVCDDSDKLNKASSCVAENMIAQYGSDRSDQIMKGQNPTAAESAQLTATLIYCGSRCGTSTHVGAPFSARI